MYRSTRRLQGHAADLPQIVAVAQAVVRRANERHGGSLVVSVNVGSDPGLVVVTGSYDHLADYQKMRAGIMGDNEIQVIARTGVATSVQDTLSKVIVPGGEPMGWVVANQARMHMPKIVPAMAFGVEVAQYVTKLTGRPVSFSYAITGDQSRVLWASFAKDMADIEAVNDKIEADAGYMNLFARAEGLYVDGSLSASIWQRVS